MVISLQVIQVWGLTVQISDVISAQKGGLH